MRVRRLTVAADAAIALQVAASVALRTRAVGPVGVVVIPNRESNDSGQAEAAGPMPLPTPGAVRLAAQLRRAGYRATARWRLVICRPSNAAEIDDAAAIVEAACGRVTAVSEALGHDESQYQLLGCDLAVGVLPRGIPEVAVTEGEARLKEGARQSLLLTLPEAGLASVLPVSGICPPPEWSSELDELDDYLVDE